MVSTCFASEISARMATALRPSASTSSTMAGRPPQLSEPEGRSTRSLATISAPSKASRTAIARPIPFLPATPVTRATLPLREYIRPPSTAWNPGPIYPQRLHTVVRRVVGSRFTENPKRPVRRQGWPLRRRRHDPRRPSTTAPSMGRRQHPSPTPHHPNSILIGNDLVRVMRFVPRRSAPRNRVLDQAKLQRGRTHRSGPGPGGRWRCSRTRLGKEVPATTNQTAVALCGVPSKGHLSPDSGGAEANRWAWRVVSGSLKRVTHPIT